MTAPAEVDHRFARRWEPVEQVDARPTVLVSSRDDAPVPHVAGAAGLAKRAEAAGWTARLTYALAEVPDSFYANGNLKKAAHRLASVAVRLARGVERGWAVWHQIDGGTWRFGGAFVGLRPYGLRALPDRLAVAA